MNSKVKIYSIILAIIYTVIIAYTMSSMVDQFKAGYKIGKKSTPNTTWYLGTLHLNIIPQNGIYSFPDKITNTVTGQEVNIESNNYKIDLNNTHIDIPNYLKFIKIMAIALCLIFALAIIYLPFLFFSAVKQSSKGHILKPKVIRKIEYMGYIIIFYYLANSLAYLSDYLISKHIIGFEKYNIMFELSDFGFLLLGFVTLLMAEILKVSSKLKEDQDLTI